MTENLILSSLSLSDKCPAMSHLFCNTRYKNVFIHVFFSYDLPVIQLTVLFFGKMLILSVLVVKNFPPMYWIM
jgi:hypothetical protein